MNTIARAAAGAAAVAAILAAAAPAAAAPTSSNQVSWGPLSSPGKGARAVGTIHAAGEDYAVIPAAAQLTVSGTVTDRIRAGSVCGWAVFNIATVNTAGNRVNWTRHPVRTCAYRTPKRFSFTYHRVYQVELKVCAGARTKEPSIQCTAGNPAWTDLYTSPH
ncbi:hypothetical protein ACFLIM_41500 [Nonomuraea sp. M3C6]|uniref:Secreted protein n=1 Tax=Nonomuraea marmarensis TaxID=3351344 RepID=A0ABW7ARN4_9ACTN